MDILRWRQLVARFEGRRGQADDNGCRRWLRVTGEPAGEGYGQLSVAGHLEYAHRLAYRMSNGPIPPGAMVRHACDNRWCVASDHLSIGLAKDNVHDMFSRGRNRNGSETQTHCKRGHEFTAENTERYRRQRVCRACAKARWLQKSAYKTYAANILCAQETREDRQYGSD